MYGLVFNEFLDFFGDQYGSDALEDVLSAANAPSGGYYVRDGAYQFSEMTALVSAAAGVAEISHRALLNAFGRHLGRRFSEADPQFFCAYDNVLDLLTAIDGKLHEMLRGLYPNDAPKVDVLERDSRAVRLSYDHCRRLEYIATGLFTEAARHYGDKVEVRTQRRQEGERASIIFDVAVQQAA
ncbi:MAG: heme NO-binding domain-containing protein [Neomegalonema sp.]|nr:heme NO-binding domain-containing protein [Neomegalonema sp.]